MAINLPECPGKRGWPWTADVEPASVTGVPISIVIPSYKSGAYMEACLRSIILQNYANVEIIVMDGGSTDGTVDILKRYDPWITYWESVKDRGQSHAINKGFARCTGEVVNWLCADDLLEPGSLQAINEVFQDPGVDWCIGKCRMVFPDRPELEGIMWPTEEEIGRTAIKNDIAQPSSFYRRKLLERTTPVLEDFHFAMDQELWCYFLSMGFRWALIDQVFSVAVQDGSNKTRMADYRYYMEADRIFRGYWKGGGGSPTPRWYRWSILPMARYRESHPGGSLSWLASRGIGAVARSQKFWRRLVGRLGGLGVFLTAIQAAIERLFGNRNAGYIIAFLLVYPPYLLVEWLPVPASWRMFHYAIARRRRTDPQ